MLQHSTSRLWLRLGLVFVVGATLVGGGTFTWLRRNRPATATTLRVAQLPISYSAVMQIADVEGYLRDEGLDYEVVSVPAGPDVVTALRGKGAQSADIGGIAITPVATMIGAGDHPVVIATTLTSNRQAKLITFSENGISEEPSTLKGKRIGVVKNTNGDIYLSRLLKKADLGYTDVVLVNGRPADLRSLLLRGDIDAAVLWDPFVIQTRREYQRLLMDGGTIPRGEPLVLVDPTLHTLAFNIVTTRDKLKKNRESLLKALRAAIHADMYIQQNPQAAQASLEKWLNLEPGDLKDFFATTVFHVELNVSRVEQWCKEELDWLKATRPDVQYPATFSQFVDASLLKSIDPDRIDE